MAQYYCPYSWPFSTIVHLSIAFFGGDEAVSFLAEEVSDVAFDLGSIDGTLASRRRPIPTRRHQMRQLRRKEGMQRGDFKCAVEMSYSEAPLQRTYL